MKSLEEMRIEIEVLHKELEFQTKLAEFWEEKKKVENLGLKMGSNVWSPIWDIKSCEIWVSERKYLMAWMSLTIKDRMLYLEWTLEAIYT